MCYNKFIKRKEMIQMKVVVCYTKVVEEVIEVDDQFEKLTDSGGYDDLSYDEKETLEGALLEMATDRTSAYYHDILRITSAETNEMMLET
jgi:hypothetical protein